MAWESHKDEEGREYFYNPETDESTWEKPEELMTELEKALRGTVWEQYVSEDNVPYFYNTVTQESVWTVPEEVQAKLDQADPSSANGKSTVAPEKPTGITISADAVQHDVESQNGANSSAVPENGPRYTRDGYSDGRNAYVEAGNPYSNTSKLVSSSFLRFNSRRDEDGSESFTRFKQMLVREGVDYNWTFGRVMDQLIDHEEYWLLSDSLTRKEVFEDYLNDLKVAAYKTAHERREQIRNEFLAVLVKYKDEGKIKYFTRWKTAKLFLKEEPLYQDRSIPSMFKKHIFEDYVKSLREEHYEMVKTKKKAAIDTFRQILQAPDMNLNARSTWDGTLKKFAQNELFLAHKKDLFNKRYVNKLDLLRVYKEIMEKQIRHDYFTKKAEEEKKLDIEQAKARISFVGLLNELRKKQIITPNTRWVDIFDKYLKNDQRFIDLCGQPGSNPLELFWDILEEEQQSLRTKREHVLDLFLSSTETHSFTVSSTTTWDEFYSNVQKALQTSTLGSKSAVNEYSSSMLEIIYNSLKQLSMEKEKQRAEAEKQRERARYEKFRRILRHYFTPGIETWEQMKPLVEKTREYEQLNDEKLAQDAFNSYKDRIKDYSGNSSFKRRLEDPYDRAPGPKRGHYSGYGKELPKPMPYSRPPPDSSAFLDQPDVTLDY